MIQTLLEKGMIFLLLMYILMIPNLQYAPMNVVKKLTMLLMRFIVTMHNLTYAAEGFKFILQEELSLLLPICISMIPNLRRWQKG
ncbi:hypothetical protein CEXT_745781 [Caerostris extrusa]|uniref:Uncharacterized protein n=1 Tax=Caerostris extrusa TaxID=172846 RepID=A0AAV4TLV0_CAEEX|nr:hypothetical protein CEXT_745781 [Caerostris extrusa]